MAFQRILELTVGPAGAINSSLKITGLKIQFDILKTEKQDWNTAKITVYNVKKETALKLGMVGNQVIFSAGYEDEGAKNLFFGNIRRSTYTRNGVDTMWIIEADDRMEPLKVLSVSYAEGTPVTTAINDIVNALGMTIGNTYPAPTKSWAQSWVFVGLASEALTQVLAFIGWKWTVQNKQIILLGSDITSEQTVLWLSSGNKTPTNSRPVPNTGLLYAPEPLENKDEQNLPDASSKKKYRAKALLQAQAVPGLKIRLDSTIVRGYATIESARFTGDNWDGEFLMELEVRMN